MMCFGEFWVTSCFMKKHTAVNVWGGGPKFALVQLPHCTISPYDCGCDSQILALVTHALMLLFVPKIYEMAYSVEQNLNSTVELLVHVMSSVECSRLQQDYITGLNALCNNALWVSHVCSLLTFGSSIHLRFRLWVKRLLHMLIGCFKHTPILYISR